MAMTSSVPYLLRAIYEWIVDNNQTPYLVVDATMEGVEVPSEHVSDGQIVLNVSGNAVRELQMTNDYVMFSARFSGVAWNIVVPVDAVLGIITRENGEGMWFPREETPPETPDDDGPGSPDPEPPTGSDPKDKPRLRVIK